MANPVPLNIYVLPDDAVGTKFSDTLDIDQEAHLLYIGDNWSGGVDVFDIATAHPRYLKTIRMRGTIYGVCVAKEAGKLFVGLLPSGLAVIDLQPDSPTYQTVLTRLDTGGRGHCDLLDFDPLHNKVYAANRNDGFMVAVDAASNAIVAKIEGLGGGLEQPRFNPADGMVYLAGNTENVLYQVDPETDKLVATLPIGVPCGPNGVAINPRTNCALLAGSVDDSPNTVIYDLGAHEVTAVIEGCGLGDGAIYVPSIDRFLFAAQEYPEGPRMGIFSGDPVELLATVDTHPRASWVAYDETNRLVYAPAIFEGKPSMVSFDIDAAAAPA